MTTGPENAKELTQDLVLTMQQLAPLLSALLALMQNAERGREGQIEALSDLMERVAAGLEQMTPHLVALGSRVQRQEEALRNVSGQVATLGQRFDREARDKAQLLGPIQALLALLRE